MAALEYTGALEPLATEYTGAVVGGQEKASKIRRFVGDPLVSVAKGVIGVPEAVVGIADILTGGRAGALAEDLGFRPREAKAILDEYLSPEQAAANKEVSDAEGFFDTILKAVRNPSTIAHSAIESAPSMFAGGAVGRGVRALAPKVAPFSAGAIGEGVVGAGSTAEQIRQESPDGTMSIPQSMIAAGSGALTGLLGATGAKLSQKLGITDIDTLLAGGAAQATAKGLPRRILEGALSEGVFEELPQSLQEQIALNVATGKPWDQGVPQAGAMGMLVGGLMGGGVAVVPSAPRDPLIPEKHDDLMREISKVAAPKPVVDHIPPTPVGSELSDVQRINPVAPISAVDARRAREAEKKASGLDFRELMLSEQADLDARRGAIIEAQQAKASEFLKQEELKRASAQETIDNTIEGNRVRQSENARFSILDGILGNDTIKDPVSAFRAELGRQGYRDTTPTKAEIAHAQRYQDIKAATPEVVEPEVIPSAPNEMDPNLVPERKPSGRRAPWEMTKQEFEADAAYQGVNAATDESNPSYWFTDQPGEARTFAEGQRGSGAPARTQPRIDIAWRSELGAKWKDSERPTGSKHAYTGDKKRRPVVATIPLDAANDPHRYLVEKALREGKAVPDSVLAQYPDLAQKFKTPVEQIRPAYPREAEILTALRDGDNLSSEDRNFLISHKFVTVNPKTGILRMLPAARRRLKALQESRHDATQQLPTANEGAVQAGEATASGETATPGEVSEGAVDAKAHEAATSTKNTLPEPTDAQKEAGNYQKGHIKVAGLDISVENPAGSKRRPEWPTLEAHYGYVKGVPARAPDKEHVDVFVKAGTTEGHGGPVFVVDQNHADGRFDEPKVMLGFANQEEATAAYLKNYTKGWESRVRGVTPMTMEQFKERLQDPEGFLKPQPDGKSLVEQDAADTTTTDVTVSPDDQAETGETDTPQEPGTPTETTPEPDRTIAHPFKAGDKVQFRDGFNKKVYTVWIVGEEGRTIKIDEPAPKIWRSVGDFKIAEEVATETTSTDTTTDEPTTDQKTKTPPTEPVFGASNKVFTADAAAKARELLRKKLGNINAGLDPETMQAGITLAGYYIEAGARSFADYSAKMIADLGDEIKPFLKSFYVAVKAWPGFDTKGMDDDVKTDEAVETTTEPKTPKEPKKEKLKDAGQKMAGKRADQIAKELKDGATGNAQKDLAKIIERATKSAVWKIELSEGATPGTRTYLERVRMSIKGFAEYAGEKAGGGRRRWQDSSSDALTKHVETHGVADVEKMAVEYIGMLEQLRDLTKDAMTIEQARAALAKNLVSTYYERSNSPKDFTELGDQVEKFTTRHGVKWMTDAKYGLASGIKEDEVSTKAKPLIRPSLTNLTRDGMKDHRNGKDVTGQDLIDTFGFRGVEFGNWVNSGERQINVNLAYDAFYDLADTLGIPAKAISLGGKLGMAFGSRGTGRHAAHYEPGTVVINLTKTKGDGTVAHEWGHALDFALRGNNFKGATDDLKSALERTYDIETMKRTLDSILKGSIFMQGRRNKPRMELARDYVDHLWHSRGWSGSIQTAYKKEADKLGKSYWGNSDELWAREFESFVYDEAAGSTPYLVSDWVEEGKTTKEQGYKGAPFPMGEERRQFHRYFRHLLDGIEWTDDGPKIKKDYGLILEETMKSAREALAAVDLKLREKQLEDGEPSKDGLYWYRYETGERGAGKQPKGYFAFDDTKSTVVGEWSPYGAVAYPNALDPSDKKEFGLVKLEGWVPRESSVYLKGSEDGAVRPDGETALDEASPEDDGTPEPGGDTTGRPDNGAGEREGDGGGTGERAGDGPGERTGDGAGEVRTPPERDRTTGLGSGQDAVQPTGANYRITDADHIGEGSVEQKFRNNVDAIKTLKAIEAENRLATPEEQKILVKYVGWGGMPQAFGYHYQKGWEAHKKELEDLLTDEEYNAARASTTNAHYTAPAVIRAMWDAVQRLGFKGGRILEPGVGVGHFFGLMPESIAGQSKLIGVELDSISARISKQLYQRATIQHQGYQDTKFPERFFDLSISNVPFSNDDKPVDKKYNKERLNLHDYYFRKSIELTRPGGIVAFITSKGTLDKIDSKARKLFAEKAEFVGAIRLPEDAFTENAGTTVTTDIIFLRRKGEAIAPLPDQPWMQTKEIELQNDGNTFSYNLNEYYIAHPEMMMGEMQGRDNRYGAGNEGALIGNGKPLADQIDKAIAELPKDIVVEADRVEELEREALMIPAEGDVKDGGYTVKDGKLFTRVGDLMEPVPEATSAQKKQGEIIRASIGLRDRIRTLLRNRVADAPEDTIATNKKSVKAEYQKFIKKFGHLNDRANVTAFSQDPDAALLLALEKWGPDTGKATLVDIDFSKRKPVDHTDSVQDALAISLNEKGRVDWDHITKVTGLSVDRAKEELAGLVYDDPETGWTTAEQYLSGDVREKLKLARVAAKVDPAFQSNVTALEAAQPADLPPSKIAARPGAPWIPGEDVANFMAELLGVSSSRLSVDFVPEIGKWIIAGKGRNAAGEKRSIDAFRRTTEAAVTWGTRYVNFLDLMDYALNGGFPTVYYPPDSDGKRLVNRKATEEANAKLLQVKEKFSTWVWEDAERAERLSRKYNDEYNAIRLRKYVYPSTPDQVDAHGNVRLPGMAVGMALRPHQAGAVWRVLESGNTYLAHDVGTGKTFTMVSAAMEAKRLGVAKKPMLAVMKSTIEQFKAEFLRLYPGANILSMDIKGDKVTRKRQFARIALNDWDAVIVTHESFAKIPMSAKTITANFSKEISNLEAAILAAREDKMNARVVKDLEKSKRALENKMEAMLQKREKDDLLSFEELGIDMVMIDEAQVHKNLMFSTKMGRKVRGLDSNGSGKAFDLFMKTNWLNDQFGRGVILSSGTPISNSVGELYTISRYLQPSELAKRSIQMFDPWANTFGDIGQVAEYLPEGGGYQMVTKFNRFVNIPELMQMVYSVMDAVSADGAGIKRPKIKGGKPESVPVPQSDAVAEYQKLLKDRSLEIRNNPRKALPDNMLAVVSDGRKAATDMRLVYPDMADNELTKTNAAVERITAIYKRESGNKGVQLVFSDLGVPNESKFNVYSDLKAKLIKQGIPAGEIAFVHDAKTDREKKIQYAKVNAGAIRVLVASTKKGGTGVNVQDRVAAIHNLDTHWNLANLLQRLGRGQRQGNMYEEIEVFNYVTEKTVDAFMWDKVQSKGRFVDQIMSGDVNLREAEDISQETMSAAEMVAVASGDPLIAEKVSLESQVQKLWLQAQAFTDSQQSVKSELARIPQRIKALKAEIKDNDLATAEVDAVKQVRIGSKTFDLAKDEDRAELQKVIADKAAENRARVEKEIAAENDKKRADKKQVTTSVVIGSMLGEKVNLPMGVRSGLGDDYVAVRTIAGDREWTVSIPVARGLTNVKKAFAKDSEEREFEITRLNDELPKLKAEAEKKFDKAEELDKKRKRLEEVESILTHNELKDAVAEDSGDAPQMRFRKVGGGVSAVSTFVDFTVDVVPEYQFFAYKDGDTWYAIEATTGLSIRRGATSDEAIAAAKTFISEMGAEKFAEAVEAKPKITDDEKEAAIAAISQAPRFSRPPMQANELMRELERNHPRMNINIGTWPNGYVDVEMFELVDLNDEGKGHARAAMADITAWLDREGRPAGLIASPAIRRGDSQLSPEEREKVHAERLATLVKFYERNGFEADQEQEYTNAVRMTRYAEPTAQKTVADRQGRTPEARISVNREDDATPEVRASKAGRQEAALSGIPVSALESRINEIRSEWANSPDVQVLASIADAPDAIRNEDAKQRSQGATGSVEGVWHGGTIYLFADAIGSLERATTVVFHEALGHYGLRGVFGDRLIPILKQIASARRGDVERKAKQYGLDMAKESDRLQAAEEVLAELAQTRPEIGFVKRAIAAIRQFLRDIGVNLRLSDDDVIAQFILPARAFVERGAAQETDGAPALSRLDQTQTEAFKRWFGDSKVVDADGEPLVVYHSTRAGDDFVEFKVGEETQLGAHFGTQNQAWSITVARWKKRLPLRPGETVGGWRTMANYLSIKHPLRVTDAGDWSNPYASWEVLNKATKGDLDDLKSEMLRVDLSKKEKRQLLIDHLDAAGWDGLVYRNRHEGTGDSYIAFRPEQIKSAIGNVGTFDPANPDIRFSRPGIQAKARDTLSDLFDSSRQFNRWWHGTVGTQQHKAQVNREFGRVYDIAQDFLGDTSRFANQAANQAPDLLPRIESMSDLKKKSPGKADVEAIASALFEGTLYGGGSPMDGVVWADDELKGKEQRGRPLPIKFNLTDNQIKLYRQALASIGESIDGLSKSLIAKHLKRQDMEIDREMSLEDVAEAARNQIDEAITDASVELETITDEKYIEDMAGNAYDAAGGDREGERAAAAEKRKLERRADSLQKRIDELEALKTSITDIETKAVGLKDHGYFPAMRFGRYAVYAVQPDANGKMEQVHFSLHESQFAANQMARDLGKEYPEATVTKGVMSKEGWQLYQGLSLDAVQLFAEHMTDEGGSPILSDPMIQGFLRAATNERSVLKRHIHRKGIAGYSTDVPRALAQFTVSSARASSSNYHMGDMLKSANDIKAGDVKDEAVKLVKYLQEPKEEAAWARGFLFFNFLGGSVASAAVNMTQPIMVTAPYLSQFTSYANAVKEIGVAAKDSAPMAVGGKATSRLKGRLAQDFERAVVDGIVSPQEIHQLRAEADSSIVGGLRWRKFTHAWGSLFSLAEQFNRATTFIAAWRIAEKNKVKNPYEFAKKAVEETQFVYNKGSRPNWARGPIGATVFTFKQFSISYIELAKRLYAKDKMAFALLMLTLFVMAGLEGLPFAEDIEDVIDTIGQWLGYSTNSKKKLRQFVTAIVGKEMTPMLLHGVSSIPGIPIDVSSRLGMHNLLPGTALLKQSEKDKMRDVQEIIGPVGGVIRNVGTAIESFAQGKAGAGAHALMPVAIQNVLKSLDMAQTGMYRDTRGKKVVDTDSIEAFGKSLGFQPQRVASESRLLSEVRQDIDLHKIKEDGIADKWAQSLFERDPAGVAAARQELREWNERNPDQPIRINMQQIQRRLIEMRRSRAERTIRSTPRELREGIRESMMGR